MSNEEREWLFRVHDILKAINEIYEFTEAYSYEDFVDDKKTYLAVLHNLMIIGEASKYIPLEVTDQYTDIPWRDIKDMRNKITHDYAGIRTDIIWQVVKDEICDLELCLKTIYKKYT